MMSGQRFAPPALRDARWMGLPEAFRELREGISVGGGGGEDFHRKRGRYGGDVEHVEAVRVLREFSPADSGNGGLGRGDAQLEILGRFPDL